MARYIQWALGGKVRQFRLTTAALEKLEREGQLESFADLVDRKHSVAVTVLLLWCGLLWQEPEVTRAQVETWLDDANLKEAMTKALEVYAAALETFAQPDPPMAAPSGGTGTPPDVPPSSPA